MEKKRKLPARAAARSEQAAKKRNITPRERSETPAKPATPQPVEEPEPSPPPPPPPLPTSIQSGQPLPTVEDAQADDLDAKDFQDYSESGVMAESLSRSRHRWLSDGLFEKFWTKPHKRKGVLIEDPKNPPKDSMYKVGTVTITIEPHIVEATMYAVKGPKPRQPQQPPQQKSQASPQPQQPPQQSVRPIIQYGPPNGSMPPPPTPPTTMATPQPANAVPVKSAASSPGPALAQQSPRPPMSQPTPPPPPPATAASLPPPPPSPQLPVQPQSGQAHAGIVSNPPSGPNILPKQPRPTSQSPVPAATTPVPRPASTHQPTQAAARPPGPAASPSAAKPHSQNTPAGSPSMAKPVNPSSASPAPAAAKPATNDPVIALLAQRASNDASLRNLMKRVAVGQAKEGELAAFQKIIDQLNAEYRQKGGQQGASAERLIVDGRTVKYFAEEVKTILEIVLATNPNQRSSELRPPERSDPLVVLLVKTALEDQRTKDMIKRIAEGRPGPTDATDLKEILDRLHRDAKTVPQNLSTQAPPPKPAAPANGPVANGQTKAPVQQAARPSPAQPAKPKGPPPAPKPDISAVVLDFGSGDRYLFPKYSILEYLPTQSGQQVVASFLIVRKGSVSEYGGDPKLDYYQPVTIRLYTPSGRQLENLARVVAPQDEVRRYMDDVMENMTRAEYVLLAMRLPREAALNGKDIAAVEEPPKRNGTTPQQEVLPAAPPDHKQGVLWAPTVVAQPRALEMAQSSRLRDAEEETQATYQRLINSVTAKNVETV